MKDFKEYLELLKIDEYMLTHFTRFEILSKIILNHQLYIPFDTVRMFHDYNSEKNLKELYSDVDQYINSIKNNGYGGTCIHLTWGLYNLLQYLNYEVKIIRFEEEHFALVVSCDSKEYYVDVAFWAPLFKPFPLKSDWIVTNHAHTVEWRYSQEKESGVLLCGGEPAKTWDGKFLNEDEFWWFSEEFMKKDNNTFLQNLYLNKWRDEDTFLFIVNDCYKVFHKGKKIEEINFDARSKDEFKKIIDNNFNVVGEEYIKYFINLEKVKVSD
ncbi:arylamine N-acetyltransferase [Lysinibacillus sp. NPDC092081]|uniref:arylamine N-acetyltransferase n=1 Tax=Lysinibacillus sp. NPDC092081 TaxID=3364131 RepID=UPI00380D08A4